MQAICNFFNLFLKHNFQDICRAGDLVKHIFLLEWFGISFYMIKFDQSEYFVILSVLTKNQNGFIIIMHLHLEPVTHWEKWAFIYGASLESEEISQ